MIKEEKMIVTNASDWSFIDKEVTFKFTEKILNNIKEAANFLKNSGNSDLSVVIRADELIPQDDFKEILKNDPILELRVCLYTSEFEGVLTSSIDIYSEILMDDRQFIEFACFSQPDILNNEG